MWSWLRDHAKVLGGSISDQPITCPNSGHTSRHSWKGVDTLSLYFNSPKFSSSPLTNSVLLILFHLLISLHLPSHLSLSTLKNKHKKIQKNTKTKIMHGSKEEHPRRRSRTCGGVHEKCGDSNECTATGTTPPPQYF